MTWRARRASDAQEQHRHELTVELAAWYPYLVCSGALLAWLDADLRRDCGIAHVDYGVLVQDPEALATLSSISWPLHDQVVGAGPAPPWASRRRADPARRRPSRRSDRSD